MLKQKAAEKPCISVKKVTEKCNTFISTKNQDHPKTSKVAEQRNQHLGRPSSGLGYRETEKYSDMSMKLSNGGT